MTEKVPIHNDFSKKVFLVCSNHRHIILYYYYMPMVLMKEVCVIFPIKSMLLVVVAEMWFGSTEDETCVYLTHRVEDFNKLLPAL